MRRLVRCTTTALLALALVSGCRTVEGLTTKPEVQSVTVVVTGVDLRGMTLRLDVALKNPGEGELTIDGYEYAVQLEGQPFVSGQSHERVELRPRGTARVVVPVELVWADLQNTLARLTGRGAAAYTLALSLLIETPVGTFRVPLKKDGCLPLLPTGKPSCRSSQ